MKSPDWDEDSFLENGDAVNVVVVVGGKVWSHGDCVLESGAEDITGRVLCNGESVPGSWCALGAIRW